jgi:GMP synthase-like glutamine amidotransferase
MKLCILDNDTLEGELAQRYTSFGAMFVRLFDSVGAHWTYEIFNTPRGEYPANIDDFDAVLLTGSKSDSFSDEVWIVTLRERVTELLAQRKKMVGVCFGHQLIGLCMGAPVARAPQGWGEGRMGYDWHRQDLPFCEDRQRISLLVSHQDQVLALPEGASLVASSDFCPVAAFTVGNEVFCVQAHPEFDVGFSQYLLDEERSRLGEAEYAARSQDLQNGHEGAAVARMVVAFVEGEKKENGPRSAG